MSRSKRKLKQQRACEAKGALPNKAEQLKAKKKKKKTPKRDKMAGKMLRGPSSVSSSSLSSMGSQKGKDFSGTASKESQGKKAQCDLCKLSYTSQKELTEHLVSLMHHTKMEDKEEQALHKCQLCNVTCSSMSEYRAHISHEKHQKNLSFLRGEHKRMNSQQNKGKDKKKNWNPGQWKSHNNPNFAGFGPKNFGAEQPNYHNSEWSSSSRHQSSQPLNRNSKGLLGPFPSARGQFQEYAANYDQYAPGNFRLYGNKTWQAADNNLNSEKAGRNFGSAPGPHGPAWGSGAKWDQNWNLMSYLHQPYNERPVNNGSSREGNRSGNSNFDFTADNYEGQWDEQSLLMQEQYLAGMEQDGGSYTDSSKSSHAAQGYKSSDLQYKSPQQSYSASKQNQAPAQPSEFRIPAEKPYGSQWNLSEVEGRHRDSRRHQLAPQWDRKRPRNEEDVQESLPKALRSVDSDSGQRIPVRISEVSRSSTPQNIQKHHAPSAHSSWESHISSSRADITKASDNILERAERLCLELREKREASQAQKSSAVKHRSKELLTQKMGALIRKQQSYMKGHIKEKQKVTEDFDDSGVSSASTLPSKQSYSTLSSNSAHASKKRLPSSKELANRPHTAKSSTLDDIRKSIEKSVYEEKSEPNPKPKASIRRASAESPSARHNDIRDVSQTARPSSVTLSKDKLKNMVNAPRSRNERVQLAKLLQSREEPRTAPRTSLQLEGLHDSLDAEHLGVSHDNEPNTSTIKLEDLSEQVRDQILTLIGGDLGISPDLNLTLSGISQSIISISDEEETNSETQSGKNNKSTGKQTGKSKALLDKNNAKKKRKKKDKVPDTTVADDSLHSKNAVIEIEDDYRLLSSTSGIETQHRPSYAHARIRSVSESDGQVQAVRSAEVHPSFPSSTSSYNLQKKDSRESVKAAHLNGYQTSRRAASPVTCTTLNGDLPKPPDQPLLTSDTVKQKFPTILDFPRFEKSQSSSLTGMNSTSLSNLSPPSADNLLSSGAGSNPPSVGLSASSPVLQPKSPQLLSSVRSPSPVLISHPNRSVREGSGHSPTPISLSRPDLTGDRAEVIATATTPVRPQVGIEEAVVHPDSEQETQQEAMSVTDSVRSDPSAAMAELLMLSEREEQVKEEMTSMELRLTRLHKLLEQAVMQINKCTERRNQLHEEEQQLTEKRLTLLRDATSSKHSTRSSITDLHNTSLLSEASPDIQDSCSARSVTTTATNMITCSVPTSSTASTGESRQVAPSSAPSDEPYIPGTALSKADWLAKFSSYLPPGIGVDNKSKKSAEKDTLPLSQGQGHTPVLLPRVPLSEQPDDVVMVDETVQNQNKYRGTETVRAPGALASMRSTPTNFEAQTSFPHHTEPTVAVSLAPSTSRLAGLPVMYVGSFKNPNVMSLSSVSALCRSLSESSQGEQKDSNPTTPSIEAGVDHSQERHATASLPRTFARVSSAPITSTATFGDISPRTEDSDIGSVASSMASGSSLGEQITRYCRSTPGASADMGQHHDLSVIFSAPSDTNTSEVRGYDSHIEVDEADAMGSIYVPKEDWECVVRPCSVQLEKLDMDERTGVYRGLDKDAVKSAEALHLLERNYEGGSYQSSLASDGKKKIRKTRQERDNCGLTRWRRHLIISSSSSEGEEAKEPVGGGGGELDTKAVMSREERIRVPSTSYNSVDSSADQRGLPSGKTADTSRKIVQVMTPPVKTSTHSTAGQGQSSSITVAECDSSTNYELVDSESIIQRSNTLKEMRQSFERTFGRSPRTSPVSFNHIISTTSDVCEISGEDSSPRKDGINNNGKGRLVDRMSSEMNPITISDGEPSIHFRDDTNQSMASKGKESLESNLTKSLSASMSSVFEKSQLSCPKDQQDSLLPGDFGPVFDLQVGNRLLFVGHRRHGVRVYDVLGSSKSKKNLHTFVCPSIQSFCVASVAGKDLIVLATAGQLDIHDQMGTFKRIHGFPTESKVKCLQLVSPVLYAGLESGEIAVFDIEAMKTKDKFVCSDRPIHCMAPAQEGFNKLLCVAAQDGAIIVVNTQNLLPLRILVGHTKTAFSIQVQGHLVYSGSGDSTVLAQNLHSATLDHHYSDNVGIVNSVFCSQGYLFTGGMDKLVRCYDTQTQKLVQVYYGADRGVITKILVKDNMLITGTLSGSVDVVELDFTAEHRCRKTGCGLNFGNRRHLFWHLLADHDISTSKS